MRFLKYVKTSNIKMRKYNTKLKLVHNLENIIRWGEKFSCT